MNNKGIALILVFVVIAMMLVLGATLFWRSINEHFVAQKFVNSNQAFWLAEAGIQKAARTLNDGSWATGWTSVPPDGYARTENLTIGSYTVNVSCTTCSNPIATSVGNAVGVERTIVARFQSPSPFTRGIFAKGDVSLSGNGKTDSYNSTLGAYGGSNKGSEGDIGTNGTSAGSIKLSGNATINGDASTGPGGTVQISGNAKVNGDTTHDNNVSLPPVVVPSCLTGLSSGGAYSVSANNATTIISGNYKYTSLSISGNGKVTITGTVKIYLTSASALSISGNGKLIISGGGNLMIYTDGACDIGGNGVANNTTVPRNFILQSTYTGSQGVKVTGNGDLYGVVYAPDTDVKNSGNGNIFGSAIGKTVDISGNGDIHYDVSLGSLTGFGSYAISNWNESINPYPL